MNGPSFCRLYFTLMAVGITFLALVGAIPTAQAQTLEPSHLSSLKWRNIGPAVTSGRIVDFAVVEQDPRVIYTATASGGAWKTTDAGITWNPVFEKEKTVSLGGIAVSRSNPNVVWVGTGEPNARNLRSTSWGNGVHKSEDGGKSWTHMGLELSQHIGRIVIHPEDPNIVYVSCLGSMWGNDPERNEARGLFKTIDGGKTWSKSLSVGEQTGIVEVVMDPRDPDRLYAGAWQRERRDWSYINVGTDGGVFRTTDGGENWDRLTNGLPEGEIGRVGLSVCRSQPDTVYAVIEGKEGGVFRSDDRGASWDHRSKRTSASMYYGQVRCDPANPDRVYVLQTQFGVSEDGGRTFNTDLPRRGVHVDHHALWIDPANADHLLLGNDGGIYISYDRGQNWRFVANLPITQFYTVAVDMKEPFYHVYGGTQDNNSFGGPSGTRNVDGIVNDDWYMTVGGDGFFFQIDPVDRHIVYTESQYGRLVRFDSRTGERRLIQPQPPEGTKYRWNWSAPILLSHHDRKTIYFASQFLFRSTNRGDTWKTLGADLTRNITIDPKYRISDYGTIRVIAESPLQAGRIGVGTDDGLVRLSRDGGETWSKLDQFPGVPERAQVSRLILSEHSEDTVYVAFTAHEDNDFRPFVLKSTDFGGSWQSAAGDLPENEPVRAFVEHPRNHSLLFAGTEFGVYISIDDGNHWVSLKGNLPTVAIHDMVIQPRENDLILGSHGRGFWILDNLNLLDELTSDTLADDAHLARVRPALQLHYLRKGRDSQGQGFYAAPNPPSGAIIDYYIHSGVMTPTEKDDDAGDEWKAPEVRLDILDNRDQLVRRLEPVQGEKGTGVQRLVWDLRHALAYEPSPEERQSFFFGDLKGPFVLPGTYKAQLQVGDALQVQEIMVRSDPLINISSEDRQRLHDTLVTLNHLLATSKAVTKTSKDVGQQMKSVQTLLEKRAADKSLSETVQTIKKQIEDVDKEMTGAGRSRDPDSVAPPPIERQILSLYNQIEGSTAAPTDDQHRLARRSQERLAEQIEALNRILNEELPRLYQILDEAGIPWTPGRTIVLPPESLLPPK